MTLRVLQQLESHVHGNPGAAAVLQVAPACVHCRRLSYGELHQAVLNVAARLKTLAAPGDVVLLCAPNQPEYIIAFLAVLAADLTVFPVHPNLTEPELRTASQRSNARLFIGPTAKFTLIASQTESLIDINNLIVRKQCQTSQRFSATPHAALMLQSSGTTGRPKIVYRNGHSLDAVATNVCVATGLNAKDRLLVAIPLSHSYGVESGLLAPILAGSAIHLCDGFDPATVASQFKSAGMTVFPGVPFMYQVLVELIKLSEAAPAPSLRLAYSAGGPLPFAIAQSFFDRFGHHVGQLYGSTEVGSVTFNDPRTNNFNSANVGRAMNGVSIRIIDAGDPRINAPLPPNIEGHVAIASRSSLDRYVDDADSAFTDGFFLTGDLGRLDESGNLTITGRIKLQIDVGGFKVNPIEIEQVIAECPEVKECVVVPMSVTHTLDRLKAIITLENGHRDDCIEDVRQHVRARLAAHKVPRVFEIRESLPKSPSGKILRDALRCE